jgi:AhpD family alkylhydroperoxidase
VWSANISVQRGPSHAFTFEKSSSQTNFAIASPIGNSSDSGELKEKIALRVASLNDCDYCASAHAAMGRRLKFDENQIHDSLRGVAADPETRAALILSEQIVQK